MAEIRLEKLHKTFGDFVAVRESNLVIENGKFVVLLGPSGCGKTTTLRMTAGLELPTSGRILLDGEDVTFKRAAQRDIAFVFQLFALYPHMNVRQNLGFPLKTTGVPRAERRRRVEEVARLLRIDALLDQPIGRLAGGDRQRVALGRAIIRRPKAFLLDEPLGTLDTQLRELMREELRLLHNEIGATTVYVTHDQVEAMSMGDLVVVMNKGEILQAAPPAEMYARPATLFVAGFIGSPAMNFLKGAGPLAPGAKQVHVAGAPVPVPPLLSAHTASEIVLGVRPEQVSLSDSSPFRGSIFGVEFMGSHMLLTVDTAAGRMKVRTDHRQGARVAENVGLAFRTDALLLFDPASERALPTQRSAAHG
jgi:multiple sugar transport system ATP-binding protein